METDVISVEELKNTILEQEVILITQILEKKLAEMEEDLIPIPLIEMMVIIMILMAEAVPAR